MNLQCTPPQADLDLIGQISNDIEHCPWKKMPFPMMEEIKDRLSLKEMKSAQKQTQELQSLISGNSASLHLISWVVSTQNLQLYIQTT